MRRFVRPPASIVILVAIFAFFAYSCLSLAPEVWSTLETRGVPGLVSALIVVVMVALGLVFVYLTFGVLFAKPSVAARLVAFSRDDTTVTGWILHWLVTSEGSRRWFGMPPTP